MGPLKRRRVRVRKEPVTAEERRALLAFGERFADVWHHAACPIELKKQIVRSLIEEILVDETPPGTLSLIVHWKGGSHTAFEMEKASAQTVSRTAHADLDVIRKMAPRYGDDALARVLNKLGRRTGKGNPGASSPSRRHAVDPDVLTLQGAARHTHTSDTTIKNLVDGGILPMR